MGALALTVWLVGLATLLAQPFAALDHRHPRVREVMAVQDLVTPDLMQIEDILGTATSVNEQGEVAITIFVHDQGRHRAALLQALPRQIRGVPVVLEVTDKFRALAVGGKLAKPSPAPSVDHKAKQTPPILLGTSGGWGYDLANGYCCGGTLGSLIKIGETKYILSNYHVLESDIVPGGNQLIVNGTLVPYPRTAETGDPIIQPGLIDVGCNAANAQVVATLVKRSSLPNSNVDAAIAEVMPGMVADSGAILEIGTISSQTRAAALRLAVKKSGRTTGLTRSTISGLNATVSVTYENECAGGTAFTKTFTGQILISNRRSKFLAAGDSGSLLVEDVSSNPRAVGLLFAGSSTLAVANPIGEVLGYFGATMVGN